MYKHVLFFGYLLLGLVIVVGFYFSRERSVKYLGFVALRYNDGYKVVSKRHPSLQLKVGDLLLIKDKADLFVKPLKVLRNGTLLNLKIERLSVQKFVYGLGVLFFLTSLTSVVASFYTNRFERDFFIANLFLLSAAGVLLIDYVPTLYPDFVDKFLFFGDMSFRIMLSLLAVDIILRYAKVNFTWLKILLFSLIILIFTFTNTVFLFSDKLFLLHLSDFLENSLVFIVSFLLSLFLYYYKKQTGELLLAVGFSFVPYVTFYLFPLILDIYVPQELVNFSVLSFGLFPAVVWFSTLPANYTYRYTLRNFIIKGHILSFISASLLLFVLYFDSLWYIFLVSVILGVLVKESYRAKMSAFDLVYAKASIFSERSCSLENFKKFLEDEFSKIIGKKTVIKRLEPGSCNCDISYKRWGIVIEPCYYNFLNLRIISSIWPNFVALLDKVLEKEVIDGFLKYSHIPLMVKFCDGEVRLSAELSKYFNGLQIDYNDISGIELYRSSFCKIIYVQNLSEKDVQFDKKDEVKLLHKVNTALTGIRSYIQMLKSDTSDSEALKMLSRIESQTMEIYFAVQDYLTSDKQ